MDSSNPPAAAADAAAEKEATAATAPAYIKPPWWLRHIVGRVVPLIFREQAVILRVRGRRTGEIRKTTVVVHKHEGERYLVTPYGNADWVRNLRAAGAGEIKQHGRIEKFTVVEIPPQERGPILETYLRDFGNRPTVAPTWAQLPDPADHPTFRIVPAAA